MLGVRLSPRELAAGTKIGNARSLAFDCSRRVIRTDDADTYFSTNFQLGRKSFWFQAQSSTAPGIETPRQ
jgi:hypothetical protein